MFQKDLFCLLSFSEKKRFWLLLFATLFFSFIEVFSLSLIIPYIWILQDPEKVLNHPFVSQALNQFHLSLSSHQLFLFATLSLILVFALRTFIYIWISYASSKLSFGISENISKKLYTKYINLPSIDFSLRNSNELIKNCTNTSANVGSGILLYLNYLTSIITIVVLSLTFLYQNPKVFLFLSVVFGGVSFLFLKLFKDKQTNEGKIRESSASGIFKAASESFLSFKEIKLYQKEKYFFQNFSNHVHQFANSLANLVFLQNIPSPLIEFGAIFLMALSSLYWYSNKSINEAVPFLFFYVAMLKRLLPNLHKAISSKIGIHSYLPSIKLVKQEISSNKQQHDQDITPIKKENFNSSLELKNIYFSYTKNKPALKNVSVVIEKNKKTAFVGPSGAGKSTLIEILTSCLYPIRGSFFIDDKKVQNFKGITHLIGYVPQKVNLLDTTIEENIAFGEKKINREKLLKAIKMAHLEDFINSLEKGVKERIGERGIRLSGGQCQRIGIARALYFEPEIIIFDEATASLDNLSETIIGKTIEEISGTKTVIAIAHRLTTIQDFDRIYVMNEGSVISEGTHQELLQKCAFYRSLNQKEKRKHQHLETLS